MSHYKPYTKNRGHRKPRGEDACGYRNDSSISGNSGDSSRRNFTARPPRSVDGRSSGYSGGNNYFTKNQQSQEHFSEPTDDSCGACGVTYPSGTFMSEDEEKVYQRFKSNVGNQSSEPVELVISNLDANLPTKQLRNTLMTLLNEHAALLSLDIITSGNCSPIAIAKVLTQEEAQLVISQLHHHKVGNKRITIHNTKNENVNLGHLRAMVVTLLQEVPGNRLPLVKLMDLLKLQYHVNVSLSDVNKLKDIIVITDQEYGGRMVSLSPKQRTSPSNEIQIDSALYCTTHCPNPIQNRDWAEAELISLPNVNIPLSLFASRLNLMLSQHMDLLPLSSFSICYQSIFEELLPEDDDKGVPLEHLVTCVNGVKLVFSSVNSTIKYITRQVESNSNKEEGNVTNPSSVTTKIQLLCREFVDLLKTTERCQVLLSKFIPAYHHHFGRQCRVADYGYIKLIHLLQSQQVSKVIQILGDGERRTITLTHSSQVRRFTSDLLKVLKAQPAQQIALADFPAAYERIAGRRFAAAHYGLCRPEDLLAEVAANVVEVRDAGGVVVSLPRRERTAEEVVNTRQFADDVVRLLYHAPQCSMLFNKFVPAYHHHFGRQCKVSDYGFAKLIELFEAIPDTVRVAELPDGDRKVCLTRPKALEVLGSQIRTIVKNSRLATLPLEDLSSAYRREYCYPLHPRTYGYESLGELISDLGDFVMVSQSSAGPLLMLADSELHSTIVIRIFALLLNPPHALPAQMLYARYAERFGGVIFQNKLENLQEVVSIAENNEKCLVKLKPFYILASQLYYLLLRAGGQVPYGNLESDYRRAYEKDICYSDFGMVGLPDLIGKMSFLFVVRCARKKTNVILNQQLANFGIPIDNTIPSFNALNATKEETGKMWNRPLVPKPDTPTTPGGASWNAWGNPSNTPDLCIKMPAFEFPNVTASGGSLLSPLKGLLSPHPLIFSSLPSSNASPHPTELPLPDKLMRKDEFEDSGVANNSKNQIDCSESQQSDSSKFFLFP